MGIIGLPSKMLSIAGKWSLGIMSDSSCSRNIAHVLLAKYSQEQLSSEVLEKEIDNVFKMNGFDKVDRDDGPAKLS